MLDECPVAGWSAEVPEVEYSTTVQEKDKLCCELEQCKELVYLGGNILQDASYDRDVVRRIGLAVEL